MIITKNLPTKSLYLIRKCFPVCPQNSVNTIGNRFLFQRSKNWKSHKKHEVYFKILNSLHLTAATVSRFPKQIKQSKLNDVSQGSTNLYVDINFLLPGSKVKVKYAHFYSTYRTVTYNISCKTVSNWPVVIFFNDQSKNSFALVNIKQQSQYDGRWSKV